MTTIYVDERVKPAILLVVLNIGDVSLKAIAKVNADDDVYPLYANAHNYTQMYKFDFD